MCELRQCVLFNLHKLKEVSFVNRSSLLVICNKTWCECTSVVCCFGPYRGCLVYLFLYIGFDKLLSHLSILINLFKEHQRSSARTLSDQTEDK